jgi:S-adenosylmethionine:tRNA ribosyltransferase-isomerase
MKISDLDFEYPEELVATEPKRPSRVMWVEAGVPKELSFAEFLTKIPPGDILVLNNTKVLKRRVFAGDLEILFLSRREGEAELWEVLFPSKKFKVGDVVELPQGVTMTLKEKGRPQLVTLSERVNESYFEKVAELPLPPYIQKARKERHTVQADESWYQTAWAKAPGSFAAPTASLHFSGKDLEELRQRGVQALELTLHVGLGTFLPVTTEDLDGHKMHSEYVEIPGEVIEKIQAAKKDGRKVWALGTTATRALESFPRGYFEKSETGALQGFTDILIQPGFDWLVVDRLLTNFHQPESTLLALVAGFADLETVKRAYRWAIERQFRLFSYGDLSAWVK